ncbi:hypothetical protein VPH35_007188 [Triticum aestivum]|uniref:uncharacterized protein n=1 Tax=Triticum aestivum TaxID=4565 RepID=UPI00043E0F1F|nr:uncharacterized protein LOC123111206 [Triticum aestivum]XP_044387886.1 uncharacterized protein LOC123111206 [Triticum aestivum]
MEWSFLCSRCHGSCARQGPSSSSTRKSRSIRRIKETSTGRSIVRRRYYGTRRRYYGSSSSMEPEEGTTEKVLRIFLCRAGNFYYPPEWSLKKGGLNKFHGQHALRELARKLDQGMLIISEEQDCQHC